jgi:hypothetical protein
VIEVLVVVAIALHGLVCSVILLAYLWRAARWRDSAWPILDRTAPEKLEPPDQGFLDPERVPASEILTIMREFFPVEYDRYRSGRLGYAERRWLWEACCSIHEAKAEIEELCS